jgi:2'-5' RNA ligase
MYIAANLTEASIKLLKEKLPPKYSKVFYHHMTMAYNPSEEILNKYKNLIGEEIDLQVFASCHNDRAHAVLIDTDKSENTHPHITLSCIEEESPVYSNELLKNKSNFGNIYMKLKGVVTLND